MRDTGLASITRLSLQETAPREPAPAEPIVKWAGGKRNLRQQLLSLAPETFATYFEPFLGGGAFFFSLAPARAMLGDANRELIQVYEAIRDDPQTVMEELDAMQAHVLDAEFYYATRAAPAASSCFRRAAQFIYLNKTCYNGLYRVNRAGQFNVPFGRYASPPALYQRENLLRVSGLLRQAQLSCGDFADVLERAGKGDFAYLDPPYVPISRTASFTRYTAGAFAEPEQRRLSDVVATLSRRGCRVLLSNSDTPLVRQLYSGYHIDTVYTSRNINSDSRGRQKIAELAIRNYALP
jgi:DNA adenine methylase